MAKYTIDMSTLIDHGFYPFDDSWNTFDPSHKKELEAKIINHYRFNEIGAETPARFKHYINQQLREIMPYYNELYRSVLFDLAPMYNTIITRQMKGNSVGTTAHQSVDRFDDESLRRMGESINKDFNGNEWFTKSSEQNTNKNTEGNLNGNHSENETINKTGTDDYTKTIDTTINKNIELTSKETTESTEVLDGETSGKTTGNETNTGNTTTWSSDTPQGEVVNNVLSINSKFLTNYQTSNNNNNKNYSENTNGNTDNTTTLNKTVDTNTNTTEDETSNTKEIFSDKNTEKIVRDKTNTDTEKTTGLENEKITYSDEGHKSIKNNEQNFADKTEKEIASRIGSNASTSSNQSNDITTIEEKSNIGVSRAKLVQEYRAAIINVDLLIIKELAENFMGVF